MVAKNDITGDSIQSRNTTKAYEDNFDRIFRNKKKTDEEKFEEAILADEFYDIEKPSEPKTP